jgi:hypothetical protein
VADDEIPAVQRGHGDLVWVRGARFGSDAQMSVNSAHLMQSSHTKKPENGSAVTQAKKYLRILMPERRHAKIIH